MDIPERFYPTTEDDIVWNFQARKVPKVSRLKSGRTVKVQAMLRRLEKEMSNNKKGGLHDRTD